MTLTFSFNFPAQHLTLNKSRGMRWYQIRPLHDEWFKATYWHAKACGWKDLPPSDVQFTYTGIMVTDPENMALVTKWCIDAMTTRSKGAGFWPDDSSEWVTVLPNIVVRHRWPLAERVVTITITERGPS